MDHPMPKPKHHDRHMPLPDPGLPGTPGYRTRDNLSGLDPVDTYAESARMEGLFYRLLLTGRLRTKNPFFLLMMFIGVVLILPIGLVIVYVTINAVGMISPISLLVPLIVGSLVSAIGTALLWNLIKNLTSICSPSPKSELPRPKSHRKASGLPKRRKDYR
jgi:hypothetical protein